MNLTPREKDKLLVSLAAMVAARRVKRGVKLSRQLDGGHDDAAVPAGEKGQFAS